MKFYNSGMCISASPCRLHFPFLYWKTLYVIGWRVQIGSANKRDDFQVLKYPQSSVFPWGRANIHAFGSVLLASCMKWHHYYLYCKFLPVCYIEISGEYTLWPTQGYKFVRLATVLNCMEIQHTVFFQSLKYRFFKTQMYLHERPPARAGQQIPYLLAHKTHFFFPKNVT
jgi:hypothetical protein